MELYQLKYFVAAAETGSFTKASARVHVSQPTLSAGIKKLEQSLGLELFERRARRTFLNAAGGKFLPRAQTILAECTRASHDLTAAHQGSTLRLGCIPTLPAAGLAGLLADFKQSFPEVALEVQEADALRLDNWLMRDRTDAAITLLGPEVPPREALDHQVLYRERMVLAFARDHKFAARQSLNIADLQSADYIYRTHCPHTRAMTQEVERHDVRPHVAFRTASDARALTMIAAGLGVSMVPDTLIWPGVRTAVVTGLDTQSSIALVWPRRRGIEDRDSKTVSEFASFAASHNWKPRTPDATVEGRLKWAR